MSKRILTEISGTYAARRNAGLSEGTNWNLIRIYGNRAKGDYAVIIADDNLFEGL